MKKKIGKMLVILTCMFVLCKADLAVQASEF